MNILIPDSWLKKYLDTPATPDEIRRFLSLSGPSVERISVVGNDPVYDIEITGNRPDAMSVAGIAREAAAILPRYGIKAEFKNDPYLIGRGSLRTTSKLKTLNVRTDHALNPRFTAIVLENVTIGPSPAWLTGYLEKTGIRSLNNMIDVTNYLMRAMGQPAHAFDFDTILPDTDGIPTMILRESGKGEKITTLDGKTHTLPGGDIVIEDGSGRLIDLCGIMGGKVSSITEKTKRVLLFTQSYDQTRIRKTTMSLSHRSEAAGLFEKGTDSELALPALCEGIRLASEIAGAVPTGDILDLYPTPFVPYEVSVSHGKLETYMGTVLPDTEMKSMLEPLGFGFRTSDASVTVTVPSFRRDVAIDVDIIEEIARMYGYNAIGLKMPSGEIPRVVRDAELDWEREIKIRMRDWGYTEIYSYSMISEAQMRSFGLSDALAYRITNPLSTEWVYMAPTKWPAILSVLAENLRHESSLKMFEISNNYLYRENDLPLERPTLFVAVTGSQFGEIKGLAESILKLFGQERWEAGNEEKFAGHQQWYTETELDLGKFGHVGILSPELLMTLGIKQPVTILELSLDTLVKNAKPYGSFRPIPKYPASYEDFAVILPDQTPVGPIIEAVKKVHPLVDDVGILDRYGNTITFHVSYRSDEKSLTAADTTPARTAILECISRSFGGSLKEKS